MSEVVIPVAPKKLVYVLILNYCSGKDAVGCYRSVCESTYTNLMILVIDNASPDDSASLLRSSIDERNLLFLRKNTGYAGGNNLGIERAIKSGAEFVFILNPDVRLPSDAIEVCVRELENCANGAAINPVQISSDGVSFDPKFSLGIFGDSMRSLSDTTELGGTWRAKTLYGAAIMIRRGAIIKAGGFDPLFFAYGEEEDLARRMLCHGFDLLVTTKTTVTHLRTNEASVSDFVLFLRLKGAYLTTLKNHRIAYATAVRRFFRDFFLDIFNRRAEAYPFKQFPIRRLHVFRAAIWILPRLGTIWRHRKADQAAAYLELEPPMRY